MKEFENLTGMKFNRWKVLALSQKTNKSKHRYWVCQCECEKAEIREVNEYHLIKGNIKSCGCLAKEILSQRTGHRREDKHPHYKRIYSIYDGMRKRCYNKNKDNYKHYGGRGITICDEWLNDFMTFYNWAINNGYQDNLTIDRIDNDGNYEPWNCRWATNEEQVYNKSDTVYITIDDKTKTILEWSRISGLSYSVLWQRYNSLGLKTKEELFKPLKVIVKVIHNGIEKTLSQLSKETGIDPRTLHWRNKQGLKDDELTKPVGKQNNKVSKPQLREDVLTIG